MDDVISYWLTSLVADQQQSELPQTDPWMTITLIIENINNNDNK